MNELLFLLTNAAIDDHLTFPTPCCITVSRTMLSSSSFQGPLCRPGFRTLFHLCRHCTSVLMGPSSLDISFQFLGPRSVTIAVSALSSSSDHLPPIGAARCLRGLVAVPGLRNAVAVDYQKQEGIKKIG